MLQNDEMKPESIIHGFGLAHVFKVNARHLQHVIGCQTPRGPQRSTIGCGLTVKTAAAASGCYCTATEPRKIVQEPGPSHTDNLLYINTLSCTIPPRRQPLAILPKGNTGVSEIENNINS